MIRVCAGCYVVMGWKQPYSDKSITSGLCRKCLDEERRKMKKRGKGKGREGATIG